MKNKFLKLSSYLGAAFLLFLMAGCVKPFDKTFTDFSQTSDFVILRNAGLSQLKAANLQLDASSPDTLHIPIMVDLASVYPSSSPVTVTLGLNDAARTAYNTANNTKFQLPATSMYKLKSTTLTIPAGQHYASTTLDVYQSKYDPTISYMIPITITDASGKNLSSNQNTIYYNVIGNPIAGNYNWEFTRWGNPGQTGNPDIHWTDVTTFVADNPTQVEVQSGYYIGPRYIITFTNTNGVLSNFKVSMNPEDIAAMAANGVNLTNGPNIIKADPVTGEYIFQYTTATRYVIDRYWK